MAEDNQQPRFDRTGKQNVQPHPRSTCQWCTRENEAWGSSKIYMLYTRVRNWAYIHSTPVVSEIHVNFYNYHILRDDWKKAPTLSVCPRGWKLSLISLYGCRFLRNMPIVKTAIFGHETWPLAKVPELAYPLSFYPNDSKFSLILLYGQWLSR